MDDAATAVSEALAVRAAKLDGEADDLLAKGFAQGPKRWYGHARSVDTLRLLAGEFRQLAAQIEGKS